MKSGKLLKIMFNISGLFALMSLLPMFLLAIISLSHLSCISPEFSMLTKLCAGTVNNKFCAVMMFIGAFGSLFCILFSALNLTRYSFIFDRADEYDALIKEVNDEKAELKKLIRKYNEKLAKED